MSDRDWGKITTLLSVLYLMLIAVLLVVGYKITSNEERLYHIEQRLGITQDGKP